MARKRSSPPPEIPADDSDHVDDGAASGDDEQPIESDPQNDVAEEHDDEESQEEEEEEAESEEEAPVSPDDQSGEKQVSSQGSESIGKSGSDSESEKSSPVPVKPIKSKPMKVLNKKPDPKVDPKPTRKRGPAKRPVESEKSGRGGGKKARVSNGDEKKSGVNRLWSEEDEIGILQGMIEYQRVNDEDPYSDLEAFYEFVKDSLHVSVSTKQLSDKIRRLKKKYLVNAEKGDDVLFVKPHEDKSFELSKKIWGGGNGVEDASKVKGARKRKDKEIVKVVNNGVNGKEKDDVVMEDEVENGVDVDEEDDEGLDLKAMYPYLTKAWEKDVSCSEPLKAISMRNFGLIGIEKMRGMEKEWKDMYVKEMQLYVKKLDLKMKHAKVVLEQMISSGP